MWRLTILNGAGDDQIATILGMDRTAYSLLEGEAPDLICWISLQGKGADYLPQILPRNIVAPLAKLLVTGQPNRLSRQPMAWPIIEKAAAAAQKQRSTPPDMRLPIHAWRYPPTGDIAASHLIRRRRSATAYDTQASISADTFMAILDRTIPHHGVPPFDAALMPPAVNLLIFAHRVAGMVPGLYFLIRTAEPIDKFRVMFDSDSPSAILW